MPERIFGAPQQGFEVVVAEPAQHEDLGARQQRPDQLERRVLGGGADQDHGAVLDHRQKGVLLGAVEAVDLVDEQQGAVAHLAPFAGGVEHPAQIGDPGKHRRQRLEMKLGAGRRAAARSSSCRSQAVPTGSSRTIGGSPPYARSGRQRRADDPARPPRRGSSAAAGRPAAAAPGSRTACSLPKSHAERTWDRRKRVGRFAERSRAVLIGSLHAASITMLIRFAERSKCRIDVIDPTLVKRVAQAAHRLLIRAKLPRQRDV